jgi:hypothetical protein
VLVPLLACAYTNLTFCFPPFAVDRVPMEFYLNIEEFIGAVVQRLQGKIQMTDVV